MNNTTKRITITVNLPVSVTVDAYRLEDGNTEIKRVVHTACAPVPREIVEALDGSGELDMLDDAYDEAEEQ